MAHINVQNLSKEFVYLVPHLRIRPFVSRSAGRFTIVSYEGISESEQKLIQWKTSLKTGRFNLGQLIARSNEEGVWAFRLNLYGVREVHLPKDKNKLVADFLADVESKVKQALTVISPAANTVQYFHMEYEFSLVTEEAKYLPSLNSPTASA
ncbi:hypothetical protein EON80_13610 [bacterium]|nr:MAG: hypothetical protein EON80_13610 [bacterium]